MPKLPSPEAKSAYEESSVRSTRSRSDRLTDKIDVAVVGTGLMGRWHVQTAQRIGARVVALADPSAGRALALAGTDIPVFDEIGHLLETVNPAIVHLCSPSGTHGTIIRECIAHGVHVLAEKPLAANAEETRILCDLAREAQVQLCPVHQYAFQKSLDRVIENQSRIGDMELVDMSFFSAGAAGLPVDQYPQVVGDILPHPVAIAQRIWPDRDIAELDWQVVPIGSAGWQLTSCIGSTTLRITLSLAARPTEAHMFMSGDKGSWDIDLFHGYTRFREGTANRRTKALRPFGDALSMFGHASVNLASRLVQRELAYPGLRALTEAFYASVAGQQPTPITCEQMISVAVLRDDFLMHTAESGKAEG